MSDGPVNRPFRCRCGAEVTSHRCDLCGWSPRSTLVDAVRDAKGAYSELQWQGKRVGDDATCVACGGRYSQGCEPGCFAGDGWRALIDVCNGAFGAL